MYRYCGYIISFQSVTTAQLNPYESAAAKLKLVTLLPCDCFSRVLPAKDTGLGDQTRRKDHSQLKKGLQFTQVIAGLHMGRNVLSFKCAPHTAVMNR